MTIGGGSLCEFSDALHYFEVTIRRCALQLNSPSAASAICRAASGRASALAAADMLGQFRVAGSEQSDTRSAIRSVSGSKTPGAVFHRPGHVAGFLAGYVAGDQGWRAQAGRFGHRAGASLVMSRSAAASHSAMLFT